MSKNLLSTLLIFIIMGISTSITATEYQVNKSYDGSKNTGVSYMDILSNGKLCVVKRSGEFSIIKTDGTIEKTFDSGLKEASSIAVDKKNNEIYVFNSKIEIKEMEFRGKTRKMKKNVAVNCSIFSVDGVKKRSFTFTDAKTAKAARIIDNKIVIADNSVNSIIMYDITTGKKISSFSKGIRTCCGIFDFCEGPDKSIVVASLGAFKVQYYSSAGETTKSFGSRGKDITSFHGCCNPVSVAYLSNGVVVTAEKSPTRVKVYAKDTKTATKIYGIDELVKGCSHIPMVADTKGNVYLASHNKGIIKCSPKK